MTTLKNDEAIYRKIRKKLYTLLGHNIEEKMLRSLISTWHAPTSIIKQASDAQTNVDYEIEKTLSALKNFKSGIRGINSYKNLNSTFIARPPVAYLDTDKFIFQLNEQLFFLEEHHSYLMQLKSSIGQDTAKLVAMNIILDYCKKLGLENDGKIGAGNGNKNKPIQFASIITGLSLKTVRIYYKNCMQRITPASELIPLI
jgi:hypothetical protein